MRSIWPLRLCSSKAELEQALVGSLKPHHRFLLGEHLRLIESLDEAIRRVGQEIETRMSESEAEPSRTAHSESSQQQDTDAAAEPGLSRGDACAEPLRMPSSCSAPLPTSVDGPRKSSKLRS